MVQIVKVTCLLHNILIDMEKIGSPKQCTNSIVNEALPCSDKFIHGFGKEVRDEFVKYFVNNYVI